MRRRTLLTLGVALATSLAHASPPAEAPVETAPAAEPAGPHEGATEATPEPPPVSELDGATALSVVVRGGASLGSFEAGALFAMTQVHRVHQRGLVPQVVTGTSAGSINSIIAALDSHSAAQPPVLPEQSLYYQVWIPIGTQGMFDEALVTASGAFTRSKAMRKVVEIVLGFAEHGMRKGEEVQIGIPVTRLEPRELALDPHGRLNAQKAGETFVFRMRGRGPGQRPQLTNAHEPTGQPRTALVTDDQGEVAFEDLIQVVLASSAIPPAFGPVALTHCTKPQIDGKRALCPKTRATTSLFVDGGFIDNLPLRLAMDMEASGLGPKARPKRLLVDPSETLFAPPPKSAQRAWSFLETGERLAASLAGDAQSVELREALRADKDLKGHLAVLQSDWPLASSPLQSFFGFFEREFRLFDFAMGMHEAERLLGESGETSGDTLRPAQVAQSGSPMQRRLACLHEVLDHDGEAPSCSGTDLVDFRAVLQSSIDRLAVRCSRLRGEARARLITTRRAEALCKRIADGGDPIAVPGVDGDREWRPRGDEETDEMAYAVRRLTTAGFHFRDLGLRRGSSSTRVRVELASYLSRMARAFASAQPGNSLLLRSAARTLTQGLQYLPPTHALHLVSGPSLELGYSATRAVSSYRHFRLASALVIDGVPSLLMGDTQSYFALSPELGLEIEPPWLTNAMLQTRLLVRGGFQFSTGDGFLTRVSQPTAGAPISRPVIDTAIAVSALQWVRLQLGLAVFPAYRGNSTLFAVRPGVGVQFDLPL